MTMKNKFWNVKTDGNKSHIDLFGYVGGSKKWNDGFNEEDLLKELREIPNDNALEISINSFGGSVYTALSIYTLLKAHKGAITFRVDGTAMSAATIITSVPNAKVVMPKGSMMMIHKVSSIVIGNVDDMRKAADDMEKLENNVLEIYAEKTGKSVDEIKEYVDKETYFTAAEAVEFGLADEVDETLTVENKMVGDVVMVNGLEVNAKLFANAPKDFLQADTPQATAISNPENKEAEKMDLEKLKAEHPDLVDAIRNEGVVQERTRIQAIEDIAVVGHEDLVNSAKFENVMSAEQLAVAILKADKARGDKMLVNRVEDAAELNDIHANGNEGLMPGAEAKQKEEAETADFIENVVRGFAKK